MLQAYKEKYTKPQIQYFEVDFNGVVIESDEALYSKTISLNISEIHPFFECLFPLLNSQDEKFEFTCIHLDINGNKIIADIILETFDGKKLPVLMVHDLTKHYSSYLNAAQVRNESIIQGQIYELKNTFLKEKEEFKNAFIANFSHELRDPLTGILTFSDILNKTQLNNNQQDYLNVVKSSTTFLKKVIDDILYISKIEVGKQELEITPFNLQSLLEELKFDSIIKAKEKDLSFISILVKIYQKSLVEIP